MKKSLYIIIFSIIFFFCQTVAYSVINSTMIITGSSIARAEADVRINKVTLNEELNNDVVSYFEDFTKDTMSVGFNLNDSDFIYYDIEIGNYTDDLVGIFSVSGIDDINYSFVNFDVSSSGFSLYDISNDLTITNNDSFIDVKKGNIYKSGSEVCLGEEF